MTDAEHDISKHARIWLESRNIIVAFLRQVCPTMTEPELEHNAAAIIARLAHHKPPILMGFLEEFKDD